MTKFNCDMTHQLAVFSPQSTVAFDSFAQSDENTFWYASDLAMMLGYNDMQAILIAINRAHSVCFQLEIAITENFMQTAAPH